MATKAAEAPSSSGIAIKSLIVLILVNIVNFYDRHVPGALAEPIRKEFGLTDTQIGWIGTAFTLLYAVVGLPLGRLADKGSRKKLLAAGIVVWGALTGMAAWAASLGMLVVSRLGVAVGEATCAPTATSWIGDLFPPERRAKPLALFMLGVPVGGALSFFFSGPIAQAFGWRRAMVFAALPALLLAPLVLLLHEPQRGAAEHGGPSQSSIFQVLQIPTFWWIVASGVLVNFNLYALGTFLPAFLQRIHHLNVGRAGIATGVLYAVGGLLGGTFGGYWGDRVGRRSPGGRMRIAALAALAAVPLALFGVRQSFGDLYIAVALLTGAYGLLNMYYGLVYASLQDVVAPALRGIAMAIYFLVMYLGGASFGPVITGWLSDYMAHRAAGVAAGVKVAEAFRATGLQQAMLVIPVLALGLALVLWGGSRSMARHSES
ncbi:MAG: MFS transporter [Acidobacteriia bacterium]|nr:MFS transporter [Terriglobia bacterium]